MGPLLGEVPVEYFNYESAARKKRRLKYVYWEPERDFTSNSLWQTLVNQKEMACAC